METTQTTSITSEAPKKKTRQTISKVSAAVLAALPGTDTAPVKKAEPEYMNYIGFKTPVTGIFGTPTEAGQGHDFASQLDAQAKAKALGSVSSVRIAAGVFDVELRLDAGGDEVNPSAPAIDAVTKLQDFLVSAVQLKQGPAGKPSAYYIRVNGTITGSKNF